MVTTQGLMEVAKFLAVKGPSGTYSHFWMSLHHHAAAGGEMVREEGALLPLPNVVGGRRYLADQSFMSTRPKMRSSASSIVRGRPE